MKKPLLLLGITIIMLSSFVKIDSQKLAGSWKLYQHTFISDGKTQSCDCSDGWIMTFKMNGTFDEKVKGKVSERGHWKFEGDDKISFYSIVDVPDDPISFISDHSQTILAFNDSTLVLEEVFCSEAIPGKSVYKKVK